MAPETAVTMSGLGATPVNTANLQRWWSCSDGLGGPDSVAEPPG
jgi:hypothetical protein